jgi:hypothetical protein
MVMMVKLASQGVGHHFSPNIGMVGVFIDFSSRNLCDFLLVSVQGQLAYQALQALITCAS